MGNTSTIIKTFQSLPVDSDLQDSVGSVTFVMNNMTSANIVNDVP